MMEGKVKIQGTKTIGYRGRPDIGLSLPWILLKGIVFQLSSTNYDRASLNNETKPTHISVPYSALIFTQMSLSNH